MHHRPSRCWTCAPIVSAATSDRRSAQPSSTAMMARSRSPLLAVMFCAFRRRLRLPEGEPVAGLDADRLRALHARDAGREFRRQQPVEEHGDDGAITQRLGGRDVRRVRELPAPV